MHSQLHGQLAPSDTLLLKPGWVFHTMPGTPLASPTRPWCPQLLPSVPSPILQAPSARLLLSVICGAFWVGQLSGKPHTPPRLPEALHPQSPRMCAGGGGLGVAILATPEVERFLSVHLVFEFPPGPLGGYRLWDSFAIFTGNWVHVVSLAASFLACFCSFILPQSER